MDGLGERAIEVNVPSIDEQMLRGDMRGLRGRQKGDKRGDF
jgi:hypothetical protein